MLLTQSSLIICYPLKISYKKCEKSQSSLFLCNEEKTLRIRNGGKKLFNNNGYKNAHHNHLVWGDHQPFENSSGHNSGIGIDNFFQGKNMFITGATGLLGKALIEKLLRSTSVNKVYFLVKAKDKEAALNRMTKDIIDSELFKCLREKYGSSYQAFLKEKLIPVVGNIIEPNFGMDFNLTRAIMEEVDVIIHSAANTNFDDRYDVLLNTNVNASQRLMRFAKTCKNLKLFVYISTAYVHGKREGLIFETPLVMGENRRKEDDHETSFYSFPRLDVTDEINLATELMCKASTNHDATNDLKKLGLGRAAHYGWHNTYTLTKAMTEMVLNEIRGDVPLLIMRPTVVESSYKEPFPGWIQGYRMTDPVIISYGKGHYPACMADPELHMDIVPLDMVVNTTIAAAAKHGTTIHAPQLNVYHVATDYVNPLPISNLFDYLHECFTSMPLTTDQKSIGKMKYFKEFDDFSTYIRDALLQSNGNMRNDVGIEGRLTQNLQRGYKAKVANAEKLGKIYAFIGFMNARFHTGNTRRLIEEMSKEEQLNFEIDATNIDWRKYLTEIHVPGLRKHVLNDTRMAV